MATVTLGNSAPIDTYRPDDAFDAVERIPLDVESSITTYVVPPEVKLGEAIRTITDTYLAYHSDNPPEWVESNDPLLAAAVAQHYTTDDHVCEIGRPEVDEDEG